MIDERIIRAARNNAEWCDLVCRAHGTWGQFHRSAWINCGSVPRFYPNVVTLAEPSAAQLELIDELLVDDALPPGWAVKDSFAALDLTSRGFGMLFEAQWIYLQSSTLLKPGRSLAGTGNIRWERVRTGNELAQWERAWRASQNEDAGGRIFLPSMLHNRDVAIVAGYRDERIVAGGIGNRSEAAVLGCSNLFASENENARDCAAGALISLSENFAGLPIVSYEGGEALSIALSLGFESLGPLRVWIFNRSS